MHPIVIVLAIVLGASCGPAGGSGYAQEPHKGKVPGIDKITSGSSRLAFSGNIQSFDEKRELLSVNTVQGGTTEVFPIKKGVRISAANGSKLKLDNLTPGANVLVYYEQKAEKRTVTEIIVLSSGASQGKNKPAPPS
jgi:3-dehydroquinate synthase class II